MSQTPWLLTLACATLAHVAAYAESTPTLYQQNRPTPAPTAVPTSGFKVLSVETGSVYEKLGLKVGDVLTELNGQRITTGRAFRKSWAALKDQKNLELQLVRDGKPLTLHFNVDAAK